MQQAVFVHHTFIGEAMELSSDYMSRVPSNSLDLFFNLFIKPGDVAVAPKIFQET